MFGNQSVAPHETGEEQPNHRQLDERFTGLHFALVIFTQASIARDPGKRALHHPSSRLAAPPTLARSALHHFEIPAALSFAPDSQLLSPVGGIRPDLLEVWEQWSESGEEVPSTFTIMQIGRGDVDREQQAQRIHEEVAFAPLDVFVRIKPRDAR